MGCKRVSISRKCFHNVTLLIGLLFDLYKDWILQAYNIHIFLIFALNHRLWVLVRTLTCAQSLCFSKTKTKNITTFHRIIIIFTFMKNRCMLIALAGFQNGLILALNREPFAPFLLKSTIQTKHFIKNRWYTCLKYDEIMRHANLIEYMGSFLTLFAVHNFRGFCYTPYISGSIRRTQRNLYFNQKLA